MVRTSTAALVAAAALLAPASAFLAPGAPPVRSCAASRSVGLSMAIDMPPRVTQVYAAKPFPAKNSKAVLLAESTPMSKAEEREFRHYIQEANRLKGVFQAALEELPQAAAEDGGLAATPVHESAVMKGFKNFPLGESDGSEQVTEYPNPFLLRPVAKK
ncbi:hypothetical protein T484DRAFT_3626737 [Baffinella frigidus]|nr:hypothetical protein T484DRAFT_3626737 [Cryptophyta sp. CCMP2293]